MTMTTYQQKKAERIERDKIRKQQEIEEFLNRVDVLINNLDSIVIPSMSILKETDKCYISYYIAKYPNCLEYSVTMYKKEYPFNIYYSKKFFKNEIPTKYQNIFTKLEQYFN